MKIANRIAAPMASPPARGILPMCVWVVFLRLVGLSIKEYLWAKRITNGVNSKLRTKLRINGVIKFTFSYVTRNIIFKKA